MRQLKIAVRTAQGALPLLVAAVVTDSACGTEEPGARSADQIDASGDAPSGSGGFFTGGGGLVSVIDGSQVQPDPCGGGLRRKFTVELPSEGVPASPGQICAATVEPVGSFRSARVTFGQLAADMRSADGRVEMAPGLLPLVVGLPTIEIVDANLNPVADLFVTQMTRDAKGFSFHAEWNLGVADLGHVTIRTTFELSCATEAGSAEAGATRLVHAVTELFRCVGESTHDWILASSGDQCIVCDVVAEMAPSPIVPDKRADDLPLARVLRLRIVELARVSGTVILLAENDGGEGLEYEWHASGGHVEHLARDVVAWSVEQGMAAPHIQAAVFGAASAAVASWGFNEAS